MSVQIDIPANDDENFYSEVVNIAWQYKKLKKKPEAKFHSMKSEAKLYLAISIALILIFGAKILFMGIDSVSILIVVVMLACAAISLMQINTMNKMTKSYAKSAGHSILTMDEEKIMLEKVGETGISLSWKNTLFMRFFSSTICLMSKDKRPVLLVLGIRHKDEIMKFITENNIEVPIIQ